MADLHYQKFIDELKETYYDCPSIHEEVPHLLLNEFHKGLYEKLSPGEQYLFRTISARGLGKNLLAKHYTFGRLMSTPMDEVEDAGWEYVEHWFDEIDEALRAWEIFPYGDKIGCGILFHALKDCNTGSRTRVTTWEIKRRKRILESVFLDAVSSFGLSKRRFRMKIETGKVEIRPIHIDWVDHFPRGIVVAPHPIIDCEGIRFGEKVIKRRLT
jgi:hypothetical protein